MVVKRIVVWDKLALKEFKKIYSFLKTESNLEFAQNFKNTIFKSTSDLVKNPEIYELDRFKFDNDGSYKAFEKFNYRVAYKITETQIRILRIRHTSREPITY